MGLNLSFINLYIQKYLNTISLNTAYSQLLFKFVDIKNAGPDVETGDIM